MDAPSVWDLLVAGRCDEACNLADIEFQESGDVFPLRNKVLALLTCGRFDNAIRVSHQIVHLTKGSTDSDFIFCGVAHWLEGNRNGAVETWRSGLGCKYTDAAGGVEIPLILNFAAVRMGDNKLEKEAERLLKMAVKSRSIVNWPGPVARHTLSLISEKEMRSRIETHPSLRKKQTCQASFYAAIKRFQSGDMRGVRARLRACLGPGHHCIAKAESHLARGEMKTLDIS